ncbi:hypothetical protein EJ05DRAFT_464799 [Pseudovirgaria hyperparasitica]|uniref:Transferase family protein n=1 Tax=Pseudovirgaria hyperparasitica TaxID=470096 RepID=A0A6A6W5S4_9PEZI|nr:uncharacterized protein EJ05DRAFT_464799 [Pseudovirgaria hyperparasitica]KAF2757895.1 hypothetical protein EJ05DRAFT_464799 [Pseudovirgaria hyperparasitica]
MSSRKAPVMVEIHAISSIYSPAHDATRQDPIRKRLSIIDSSCANFTPTGALWYLERSADESTFAIDALRESLKATLQGYLQFTGRLRMVHQDDEESHANGTAFYNRLEVWYGDANAPGVTFVAACSTAKLDDFVPTAQEQAQRRVWKATDIPREDVFLSNPLANGMTAPTYDDSNNISDPVMVVQVTSLCDGVVIGVKISHPLADAHTLALFVRDWSSTHAAMHNGLSPAPPTAIFEPQLIDDAATKALHGSSKEEILSKALSAPMQRFDWWDCAHAPFRSVAMQPPEILRDKPAAKTPIRKPDRTAWHEWNRDAPVEHVVLHFSAAEISSLREHVALHTDTNNTLQPSTHDILLAHIWSAITRARGFTTHSDDDDDDDDGNVHAALSFSLRTRLSPPLPSHTTGSPIANITFTLPAHTVASPTSLAHTASTIRTTLHTLTPSLLAAHIYSLTQETTPQRIWQLFLGRRHVIITSWARTGCYDVDFGTGKTPRYVHPMMPAVDGCVQVMEAAARKEEAEHDDDDDDGKWFARGVNVNVFLTADAMEMLLREYVEVSRLHS